MLNVKSTNSPITVIHEDTKLILEALKNIDPILENKPVRLPLLVTDRFRSPQGLALLVCELWDSVFKTNKKLLEESGLIVLASEMVSALIASDQNDHQSIFTFEGQKIEKLFSYVFLNPYNERYKQTFLEQLEKWFAYKDRVVSIKNDIIITLILREDLELNFDKKLIELLNKNPMNIIDNALVEHADITRDVIWNSVLFNLDNIGFIDLMQPIVNACDCKFLY